MYDDLVQDVLFARACGGCSNVRIPDMPTEPDQLNVFVDRIGALRKFSTEENRGRWFAKTDRALDICPVWSALRACLVYREMRITGVGVMSEPRGGNSTEANVKKSSLDGGILKCCMSLMSDRKIRMRLYNYAFMSLSFRRRSGMRTANYEPPGQKTEDSLWYGHAAQSAMHLSHAATGGFIKEINESLHSIKAADFDIADSLKQYKGCEPYIYEPTKCPAESFGHRKDLFANMTPNIINAIAPGAYIIDYLGSRLRSQGVYSFGVLAFAGILHQDMSLATEAYNRVKTRTKMISALMSRDAKCTLPEPVLADLQFLCRDDIYVELSQCISKTMAVDCCRRLKPNQSHGNGDENRADKVSERASRGSGVSGHSAELKTKDELSFTDEPVASECREPKPALGSDRCPGNCACNGASEQMSLRLQDICCGLFGTKWNVEDAFNEIRKVRVSAAVNSKGQAANTNITKYGACISNSIKKSHPRKSCPVQLSHAESLRLPPLSTLDYKKAVNNFVNQQYESSPAFYRALKTSIGWSQQQRGNSACCPAFETVLPKQLLGTSLVEALVAKVPETLWGDAWKSRFIPPGVVLYNPWLCEFRVTLDIPSKNLVSTWPCQAVVEGSLGNAPSIRFEVVQGQVEDIESYFIYVHFPKYPNEPLPECLEERFNWYAVRTNKVEPCASFVPSGEQLCFARPRAKLKPVDVRPGRPNLWEMDEGEPSGSCTAPNPVYASLMDTVGLMEWLLEEGLPKMTLHDGKRILFESRFGEINEAHEPDSEAFELLRETLRKDCQKKDFTTVFQELWGIWHKDSTEEETSAALGR